jgi:UDP-glucuronate 4-epimerase
VVVVDELNDYYDVSQKHANLEILTNEAEFFGIEFRFYKQDIADRAAMEKIILDEKIDGIVHLAARAGVRASIQNPDVYIHSNVLGSTVLFELAAKYRIKIVYASSSSV